MTADAQNNTFASPNSQAITSACKRVVFCLPQRAKDKRTAPIKKQPFQLTNFSPFGAMTAWTRRKGIRIVIKPDYFSTFYAPVATLSGFFTCSVHTIKFK
jgi:hypothetical protein